MTPVGAEVDFHYDLTHLIVDSRIATPVALFLTEAVSNAFKHAVPQHGQHEIGVVLETLGRQFTLEIRNRLTGAADASGETDGEADRQRLGMRLLRSFAAQLDGSFEKIVDAENFRLVLTAPVEPRGSAPSPSGSA
jgi:two-component system, sensor histidine kinase PdtaS